MNSDAQLVLLDYQNEEHVDAAAELHKGLLGDSPIPQLGNEFMTKFYYTKLIKDDLIRCVLCKHRNQYVGFLAYTKHPCNFMLEGKKRYFLYLSFLIFKSLISNPLRLRTLLKVIQLSKKRRFKDNKDKIGEILSLGVLTPYLKLGETGLRVSKLLFEHVATYFKQEGYVKIQAEVKKDNIPALFFYHSLGARIEEDCWSKEGEYLVSVKL